MRCWRHAASVATAEQPPRGIANQFSPFRAATGMPTGGAIDRMFLHVTSKVVLLPVLTAAAVSSFFIYLPLSFPSRSSVFLHRIGLCSCLLNFNELASHHTTRDGIE